ncbi:MAG: hypothetical protein U1E27_03160, partial [Kiritimatiellia bacterium]|nr:hypothetical protein [Kiritimatiellia bacterium]
LLGMIRWTFRPARIHPEDRMALEENALTARAVAIPEAPNMKSALQDAVRHFEEQENSPKIASIPGALETIRRRIETQSFIVPPGHARSWPLRLPFIPDPERPLILEFRLTKSVPDIEPVPGIWILGATGSEAPLEQPGAWRPMTLHRLVLSAGLAQGERDLTLTFVNLDPGASILFEPGRGIELLAARGSFESNLFRALLVLLSRLAFLTAVGLAAGTLFSLPVAVFFSFSLALLLHLNAYVGSIALQGNAWGEGDGVSRAAQIANRGIRTVYQALHTVLGPLDDPGATQTAASGRRISWETTGRALWIHIGLYGGALALLSVAALRRRELGAPS